MPEKETLNMYAVGDKRGWKATASRLKPYIVVTADWWEEMNSLMLCLNMMAEGHYLNNKLEEQPMNLDLRMELIDRDLFYQDRHRFYESIHLPKNRLLRIPWRIRQIFKYWR